MIGTVIVLGLVFKIKERNVHTKQRNNGLINKILIVILTFFPILQITTITLLISQAHVFDKVENIEEIFFGLGIIVFFIVSAIINPILSIVSILLASSQSKGFIIPSVLNSIFAGLEIVILLNVFS